MSGKGSKQRPANLKKFRKNFEKVFNDPKVKAELDELSGAIKIESKASEARQEREIKLIKEWTDHNGVEMVVINIDNALTNKIIPKNVYRTMLRDPVSYKPGEDHIIELEESDPTENK